ncbi:MAG: putative transport system permease protein [Acidobacteriota bacterium]|jgi:putative ABC transport system permease protein|nr:putative transport system permease protein [Acidobacteriota bacterium]
MLAYNLRLAWKSLRRNPILSVLIVGGIALGVAISTAFITVYHVFSADPLPNKSGALHYVQMDNWDPKAPAHPGFNGLPPQLTYRDVRAIMPSKIPVRQTANFSAALYVFPDDKRARPSQEPTRLVFSDFFQMFEVPFKYGSGWSKAADGSPAGAEPVVVINSALNEKLFGGANSVGKTLRIDRREFRIVGVIGPWRPRVKMYDINGNQFSQPESVFLPFNWIEPMEIRSVGNRDNWKSLEGDPTFVEALRIGEANFIQMWVELPDAQSRQAYQSFLDAYTMDQRKIGRFERPLKNLVSPMPVLMRDWGVVPPQTKALAAISVLFLVVSALNLVGLFLGKFLARAPHVGIRRALGASRRSIFLQHLIECELVGLIGGAIGLLLSLGVLAFFNNLFKRSFQAQAEADSFFRLDPTMILAAVLLSLVAGAIAGIYPAWRICSIPPARHLRNQ